MFHEVIAPQNFDVGVLPLIYARQQPVTWGHQVHLPAGESTIGAFLFEFRLADGEDMARDQMSHIERLIRSWLNNLRDWLEVTTHQDLSVGEPLDATVDDGQYAWSWKSQSGWTNAYASYSGFIGKFSDRHHITNGRKQYSTRITTTDLRSLISYFATLGRGFEETSSTTQSYSRPSQLKS